MYAEIGCFVKRLRRRTKAKRKSSRGLHQGPKNRSWRLTLWGLVVWVLGVPLSGWTFVALYYEFSPNITISTVSPLNPSDPFSTPFVVSNNSILSIHDVTIKCRVLDVKYVGQSIQITSNTVWVTSDVAKIIDKNESITALCHLRKLISVKKSRLSDTEIPINYADIAIITSFRPSFAFWTTEIPFRFITAKSADGQLRWLRQPMGK